MKLQFKHQAFQEEAALAVCDVFAGQPLRTQQYRVDLGDTRYMQQSTEISEFGFRNQPLILRGDQILKNLRAVQVRGGLKPSDKLSGPGVNLSIEMETGTGKTYTYAKTMYELNARYGWSKFIIVVPSVAIREGVYKSLQTTQEHFAGEYGKKLRFFIYSSDHLDQVDHFATDSAINVMIINMQAFNSSKNQRIIDKKLDTFRSRRPVDIIARTNPILIIDEPQSVEGKKTKESLQKFNALFTLRYSATHKEKYDMVYRLDAMDAYNQHLVKKIAALGVTLTGSTATNSYVYLEGIDLYKNKGPTARLGFEVKGKTGTRTIVRKVSGGEDLYALSNELDEYADRFVILPDGIDGRDNSVTFLNGLKLYAGQISGNEQMTELQRRVQIRETIRMHIEKERELYPKGIKVLSLFFIDEVAKYRVYDDDHDDSRNGEYARMFEEEYENVVHGLQRQFGDDAYMKYLDSIDVHETHQGYFSIDKKKGMKARFVEGKIDKKTQTSNDADAYDLIMKDKERLLSFYEPVRFIFSHSALREGWDNPNVFQICMLKPQSESEIRSRQEIGRGLRLCVNQQGERMDESVLGADVQELNKLTLITDMSFGKFAEALQQGLADALEDRPKIVDAQLFENQTLVSEDGRALKINRQIANAIYDDLLLNGYVKQGQMTEKYYAEKESGTLHVAEEVAEYGVASVAKIISTVFDAKQMQPENANGNNVEAVLDEEKLHKQEFQELWRRINHKSFYTVAFDSQELIDQAVQTLNAKLDVTRVNINLEYGEQRDALDSKEQLEYGDAFRKTHSDRETAEHAPLGSVRYDLLGKLVEQTDLTRATIAKILQGMDPDKFAMFKINPEEFILKVGKIINDQKATQIIEHIAYNKLDASYDTDVFTGTTLRGKLGINAMEANHSLYSHIIYDSQSEATFAKELEVSKEVAVYVKLPSSFFISTPVGKYNPDWAIAFNEQEVKHVYFVAETKGNISSMELRGVEQAKIECARAHFKAISNDSVVYDVVDNYSRLMDIVMN